ncbi:MAG TPA: DNA polymerase domain-containing protein, partial [Candidatus Limnocylindrales bacterium]|nr:DNA polymerase domain-containing protein [Candidatus Limnocylindrales bacterium]
MTLAARLDFYDNPLLFGRDGALGLLAFDLAERAVRVHARTEAGVTVHEAPFRPFILLTEPELLRDFKGEVDLLPLEGEGAYRWVATLASWADGLRARDHARKATGQGAGAPDASYRFLNDAVHQFLLWSGKTSFRGLAFGDLRRMALDIEVTTAPGFEFPNAAREADRIIAIALADSSGWSTVLSGAHLSEADLLAECSRLIRERDPDVLEGHNIFRFDLEYLEARARRHRVPLRWGRDGSVLSGHPSRMQVAERAIGYRRYHVPGRHIVDTWILAQLHDVSARDLPSYGLKDVARHFGVAAPARTYLPPEDIPRIFREDPERLMAYARDDVLETLAISAILSLPYFIQAQALPFDYESVVLRGNATKIDALLLREYLHRRHAVPRPSPVQSVAGGHTAVFQRGVARNVLHVDVTSLYPSLMLTQAIGPGADRLGVFASMLHDLREFRVSAKRLAREAPEEADRLLLNGLQQTFKILINSFYGYLGFSFGHWNDFEAANRVTLEGRRLVLGLVDRLTAMGAVVIEVDTDGLYFVPPASGSAPGLEGEAIEKALLAELGRLMPAGIELELAGRFGAMLSYKMKNYVLMDARGKLSIKGSGLRSRGLELFQRQWMEEMFRLLLSGQRDQIPALVKRWEEDFRAHRVAVRQFMKTETLQESLASYREKIEAGARNPAAPYELALASRRPYQAGDQVSYYVAGDGIRVKVNEVARLAAGWDPVAPDENTAYYLGKLQELY